MTQSEETPAEIQSAMLETSLGPVGAGLPPIPEPSNWKSAYGMDEAVAIAVVPERAMIFWELARIIEAGVPDDHVFKLVRLRLIGDTPKQEADWPIEPIGRFQDSGVVPGGEYLYMIVRVVDGEETPLMVTNPIRMPERVPRRDIPVDLPSSIDLPGYGRREVPGRGRK